MTIMEIDMTELSVTPMVTFGKPQGDSRSTGLISCGAGVKSNPRALSSTTRRHLSLHFSNLIPSGARFIGLSVDYFCRFLFGDAVSQATSKNSAEIFENKVVDKIGYSRAVSNDKSCSHPRD